MKVAFDQLRQWYRTLDELLPEEERIEREIYLRLRDLFSLRTDLIFYDITSTCFEGEGPSDLAQVGYSRDGNPRHRQIVKIVIGVVMMDGWLVAHHVCAGNRLDRPTVEEVVKDVNRRFELERIEFVGDRGVVSVVNIERLQAAHQGNLVGLQRRNGKSVYDSIREGESQGQWDECPAGITASEKSAVPRTRVQEVPDREPGVRIFVVHSEERELYERGMRELSIERTRKALEAIKQRVERGDLKEPEKM